MIWGTASKEAESLLPRLKLPSLKPRRKAAMFNSCSEILIAEVYRLGQLDFGGICDDSLCRGNAKEARLQYCCWDTQQDPHYC